MCRADLWVLHRWHSGLSSRDAVQPAPQCWLHRPGTGPGGSDANSISAAKLAPVLDLARNLPTRLHLCQRRERWCRWAAPPNLELPCYISASRTARRFCASCTEAPCILPPYAPVRMRAASSSRRISAGVRCLWRSMSHVSLERWRNASCAKCRSSTVSNRWIQSI